MTSPAVRPWAPRQFTTDAERRAYRLGAQDEAQLRDAPRKALPDPVRQLLDYLDAMAKHHPQDLATPGDLLKHTVTVFRSTLTTPQRRAIRRLLGRRAR